MKNILWDFDGVILDSMSVRDYGFREVLKSFGENKIEELITFHRLNGGLSRYVKFDYFFKEIMKEDVDQNQVDNLCLEFSRIMKSELVNSDRLIKDSVSFIQNNYNNYNFHIVSGSDQTELRFLCKELEIDKYFKSIHGSPVAKKVLVGNVMSSNNYSISNTCLIGDSINDFEAAEHNNIKFFGYNNEELKIVSQNYINSFNTFIFR